MGFPARAGIPVFRVRVPADEVPRGASLGTELPLWDGNGYLMHTTAEDMGRFIVAFLNGGQAEGFTLLEPEMLAMMHERATSFSRNGRQSRDLAELGYGSGLFEFRDGWFGHGGSVPGFLALLRFNPARQVGYAVIVNVNALHGGGAADRRSVLEEVYRCRLGPSSVCRGLTYLSGA